MNKYISLNEQYSSTVVQDGESISIILPDQAAEDPVVRDILPHLHTLFHESGPEIQEKIARLRAADEAYLQQQRTRCNPRFTICPQQIPNPHTCVRRDCSMLAWLVIHAVVAWDDFVRRSARWIHHQYWSSATESSDHAKVVD